MTSEQVVAQHYAHGSLEQAILKALEAAGKDLNQLSLKDLSPVDEFHIGGRLATIEFAKQLGLRPGMRILDIGCGLGGAGERGVVALRRRVISPTNMAVRSPVLICPASMSASQTCWRRASI